MVKREDAKDTSRGRVRDTDRQPEQPVRNEADAADDLHEGRYKPEMGTIVVTEYPASNSDAA